MKKKHKKKKNQKGKKARSSQTGWTDKNPDLHEPHKNENQCRPRPIKDES